MLLHVTENLQVGQRLCFLWKRFEKRGSSNEHTLAAVGQSCGTVLRPQIFNIYVRAFFCEALQKKRWMARVRQSVFLMRDLSLCVKGIIFKQHLRRGIQNKLSRFKFCWSSISRYFTWLCICLIEDWLSTTQTQRSSQGGCRECLIFFVLLRISVQNLVIWWCRVFFMNSFLFAFL